MADLNISIRETAGIFEDMGGNNLIKNGNFENAPSFTAAQTAASTYVNGTAGGSTTDNSFGSWGVLAVTSAPNASTQFDSSVSHSGTYSIKLSTLNTSATIALGQGKNAAAPATSDIMPAYANTSYSFTGFAKTNNVVTNSAYIDIREFSSSFTQLATNSTNKLSGTNDWTLLSKTWITNASCVYLEMILRINVAGNISDVWYDDLVLIANGSNGNVNIPITAVVSPGIQDINGPKIWS